MHPQQKASMQGPQQPESVAIATDLPCTQQIHAGQNTNKQHKSGISQKLNNPFRHWCQSGFIFYIIDYLI